MNKRGAVCWALLAGLTAATAASAAEEAMPTRSLNRFELDTETARGFWGEVATFLARDDVRDLSADLVTIEPRLIYGGSHMEAGLALPFHIFEADGLSDEDGVGDLRLYGKGVVRMDLVDAGAGLEVTLPTGSEHDGLGAGTAGFLPFLTLSVHLGPVDLRGHFGYHVFVDAADSTSVTTRTNSGLYGGGLFLPIGDYVAVRAEFLGQRFSIAGPESDPDTLSFQPGLDVRLPLGRIDLLLRPTGLLALDQEAPDWGVGGAVALNWKPMQAK